MDTELYLKCACGDEVLVIENDVDEEEYIISMRTIPVKKTWRSQIRKLWDTLKDGFNYEVILTEEQMEILAKWINTNTSNEARKPKELM